MTDNLQRSVSSGNGSSPNMPRGNPKAHDNATAEAVNCPDRQPNLALGTQALQILDSSDDCIKLLDLEGRILFMSRGGQLLLGIQDITPFLDTSWVSFWQAADQPAASETIAKARAGGVCIFQGYCPTLSGEPKWWECKVSPMQGADGQIEQLLCISRDITERKQAETALQASEEQFRLFTTASSDTVYKMSADWREMRLLEGKNFLASTQHPNQTWLEQYIPAEEQTRVKAAIAQAIRTKDTFELEHRVIQLDGTIGWTFSRAIPLLNDQNEIVEWLGAASDVTARKQAELSANFLAIVTQNLAEATSVEDIIQIVGDQLNRYLHISNCAFVEINESAEVATIAHSWHQADIPSLMGIYHLPEFVTGEFFQTAKLGQTIIVRDVTTDPRIAEPKRFAALKIGSFINVPLIRNGEWKFTLGIYHPIPYNWRSDEINLMCELANRIWTKLERTRVEIALRQNQEMFSALVADAPFGVYIIDAEFRVQQANQTAIAAFNVGPLVGRALAEVLRMIWREPFAMEAIDRLRHTLATGEPYYSIEMFEPRSDVAEIQSYDWQVYRITLPNGSYGLVCYFYDLSEIKRAEEIIRRTGDRDAFLVNLNDALRPLTNASEIQAVAARILGESLGATRVIYIEVVSNGEEVIVQCNYVNGVEELSGRYRLEDYRRNLMVDHQAGRTQVVADIPGDPKYTDAEKARYRKIDIAAHIDVPLIKNNQFVALLAAQQSTPRQWTEIEVNLVEETAERTWAAVERARAEVALRESEARKAFLLRVSDALRSLAEPVDIQETVTQTAINYFGADRCYYCEIKDGNAIILRDAARGDLPSVAGVYPLSRFPIFQAVVDAGRPFTVQNVHTTDTVDEDLRQLCIQLQVISYINVPVIKNGKTVGSLCLVQSTPRNWTDLEVELAVETAERTWAAVERAHAESALRQSEERYRTLFELIDEGFCVVEVLFDENDKPIDYRFLEINPAFEQQTGLQQAIGKTARQLVPDLEDFWVETYGRVALTGESVRLENTIASWNRWFDVYACRMGQPQERKVAIVFKDISDRKQTEAAIAADLRDTQLLRDLSVRLATEDSIQALYQEILATAITLTQADAGSVQILDETTQDLVLLATQGFEQSMIEHFYRVNASSRLSCGMALRSGVRSFVDFDVPESEDPDGSMRLHVEAGYLCAQSTPLITRTGKPIGMVSTHWHTHHRPSDRELRFLDLLVRQAADLIEQRQAEAQRKQLLEREQAAREEAERANRIKDEFLAVLSHELRSPLNPILGWSKLLQGGKLDETKTAQALATIERNAKLQSELIEDLLDVSRILRGKLSLNVAPVNLAAMIRGAMETVRLAAEAKSIQIAASLAPHVGLVLGDSTRLQQVIWNLLSNAVKFTPPGGQVNIRLERLDSSAQITVNDTGQGIAPDFLPYVFDYFRQADGATTRKFGGLGLGLAIVRHLVELHGGTVRADSLGEGQGATFTIRLPLLHTPSQANQDKRSPQQSLDLSGIKILVVDDEPDTRELVAFVLEQQGAQVTTATSAHEALLILPQAKPDVLLSDIGMPDMDGYMLIQQVRMLAPEQGGKIPAIALTAYAGDTNQQQVIAAGFQKHISKPIEPEELVQVIKHLIRST